MKHISFSLFGYDPKYYVGAEKNIIINKELLPDWTTVIYYHPENILQGYVEKLTEMGAVMIDVSKIKLGRRGYLNGACNDLRYPTATGWGAFKQIGTSAVPGTGVYPDGPELLAIQVTALTTQSSPVGEVQLQFQESQA